MGKRHIYGVPTISLSEAVEQFMALQGNIKRSHFLKYLIAAKWAWKDLLWGTIYEVKQLNVKVNLADNTVNLPNDIVRLLNISVVDADGRIQPFTYDEGMNTLKLNCPSTPCSCTSCNGSSDTLCDAIDSITMRTESVIINGEAYEKRIYNMKESNGDIYEVSESPYYEDMEIKYESNRRVICNLEVDVNGCPKATESNKTLLKQHCGCYVPAIQQTLCKNFGYNNNYGYYKEDAIERNIIHLRDTKAEYVTISYQCNGEPDHIGIMIPEYAVEAFFAGLEHRITAYSPVKSRGDKMFARSNYATARTSLNFFLNPISVEDFMNVQSIIAKWG